MPSTIGQIYDLYIGFTLLDRDESLKLSADTRLKLAININLLKPFAEAYERSRTRVLSDLNLVNRKLGAEEKRSEAELQADFADANEALRAATQDIDDLKMLARTDLKLDENTKISASLLARLLCIVEKIEV